jgi:hypothetical protein
VGRRARRRRVFRMCLCSILLHYGGWRGADSSNGFVDNAVTRVYADGASGFASAMASSPRSTFCPLLVTSRVRTGRNGGRDEWAEAHFLLLQRKFGKSRHGGLIGSRVVYVGPSALGLSVALFLGLRPRLVYDGPLALESWGDAPSWCWDEILRFWSCAPE